MSMKSEAVGTVTWANNRLGGAISTRKQRRSNCRSFIDWCFKNNRPLMSMRDARFDHVNGYFRSLGLPPDAMVSGDEFATEFFKLQGSKPLSISTLHNLLGSIRRAIQALRGDPDALGITAKALGLPKKNRDGKKLPMTDDLFVRAVEATQAAGELGFALCLRIERYFGHRGLEALMSPNELKKYALEAHTSIRQNNYLNERDTELELAALGVRDGTKGGRYRQTVVIKKYARESLEVIRETMAFLTTHKFLVQGKTDGLKSARAKYCALAKRFALTGQYSPHSLRYRYAVDKLEEMRDAGVSKQDALVLCAAFLGHGPARGQLVSKVYGRTIVHTFPKTRKRRDFAAAQVEVSKLLDQYYPNPNSSSETSNLKVSHEI